MQHKTTYLARLLFRVANRLDLDARQHRFRLAGRDVILRFGDESQPNIKDSDWLSLVARGFGSVEEAERFGRRLRHTVELASVCVRLGVDVGRDLASTQISDSLKQGFQRSAGIRLEGSVHGLSVLEDLPNTMILNMRAKIYVPSKSGEFVSAAESLFPHSGALAPATSDIVALLNYALSRPDPVSKIVFAISAVEMLGQDEAWTPCQKRMLKTLAQIAGSLADGTEDERAEVAQAIAKSVHRITLRQGVFRLLDRLGLTELRREWDRLYGERSALIHGIAPVPGADYSTLAHRVVSLCGRILMRALEKEIPSVATLAEGRYQ